MKLLHTMIRVKNLEASIHFYTRMLGMKLLARKDYPGGKFTLAFVGYGVHIDDGSIELTHNWESEGYEMGNAFVHIAIGVTDIHETCRTIEELGGKIVRPPGPMKHGTTLIAFLEDPDGYKIELIQR